MCDVNLISEPNHSESCHKGIITKITRFNIVNWLIKEEKSKFLVANQRTDNLLPKLNEMGRPYAS